MVPIHPQKIDGIWQFGVALDLQTTRSTPMGVNGSGHMQFDTQRPPLAQLLYRLKYQGDAAAAPEIVQTAADWLRQHRSKIDVLIPVPPSQVRALQPVLVLATGIGMALALPVLNCITLTKSPSSLKAVDDPAARETLLEGLYTVDADVIARKNVLLFDDVFRSGATMNAIAAILLGRGRAASVRALAITRTRTRR